MLSRLAVALVHYPVLNRRGETVATAVTNLDVHDIARTCRTYGVGRFYIVTPVSEQQALVQSLISHWQTGFGASHNPDRREAMELAEIVPDLTAAARNWQERCAAEPLIVLTSARGHGMTFAACRARLETRPHLLVLGTGSGLAPELFNDATPTLEPIQGAGEYNHLPVRAALAIMLDRLHRD